VRRYSELQKQWEDRDQKLKWYKFGDCVKVLVEILQKVRSTGLFVFPISRVLYIETNRYVNNHLSPLQGRF
jgi:hypothetical protein